LSCVPHGVPIQADSEFERERCNRLLDQQTESRKQAEEMLMRNGKYQAMVTDLQALRPPHSVEVGPPVCLPVYVTLKTGAPNRLLL
jgi:hypothetical protein